LVVYEKLGSGALSLSKHLVSASKFMSLVLRHQPEAIGLSLDAEGWAPIDELVRLSSTSRSPLSTDLVHEVVRTSDKQRFRVSEDGLRIRASQGHSVEVDLALPPSEPPDVLFHGTATRFLASIMAEGLRPGSRQHVHLSADEATAVRVGERHGKPVVLVVAARAMHEAGHTFFVSDNGVWLTAAVPARYLSVHTWSL
jgi:putative RNA 2'-phosphotransferase